MELSINGLDRIKKYEEFKSTPYLDSVGIPTIGYGTTVYPDSRRVTLSDHDITKEQATVYLEQHCGLIADKLRTIIDCNINQNQFDAIMSLVYNIGFSAFKNSTLLKCINEDPNNLKIISKEWMKWIYAGKEVSRGLKNRRSEELSIYCTV